MKKLTIYIILISVLLGGFAIQQHYSYIGPGLSDEKRIENEMLRVELLQKELDAKDALFEQQIRRQVVTNTVPYVIIFLFISASGLIGIYLWTIKDKRKEAWARPIDGMYALQDVTKNGVNWRVDINKSPSGVIGVTPYGGLIQAPVEESFGPDRQLEYINKVQTTRSAIAVSGEDGGGFKYAAVGKFLAGGYDKAQKSITMKSDTEDTIELEQEYPLMTIQEAVKKSSKNNWIIGQSKYTGDVSSLNIREVVHLGIIGSSNTGKTASTGLLTAFYARKSGYHVIVFDAKGGIDWTNYSKYFEVHKTNQDVFLEQIKHIFPIYQERIDKNNEAGVETSYDRGEQPIFIIFEEFGALCDGLKAKDLKEYNKIIKAISQLLRVSRAGGIHFGFIDQDISRWDNVIRSLIKYWIGYKIEASGGHALKMYKLSDLENVGQFASSSNKKDRFQAWHTKEELDFSSLSPIGKHLLPTVAVDMKPDFFAEEPERIDRRRKPVVEAVPIVSDEGTTVNDETIIGTPQDKLTGNLTYDNLSEEEIDMIISYYQSTQSFKQTSEVVWGGGKYGKFYNDVIRQVLKDNGIKEKR